jgi:hypothetical protein
MDSFVKIISQARDSFSEITGNFNRKEFVPVDRGRRERRCERQVKTKKKFT